MKILPAIDIKDGKCVRLAKGDYNRVTHYFDNPLDVAKKWIDKGSMNLHIVDLDGAKSGETINFDVISKIRNLYQQLRKSYSLAIKEINQMKNQIVTLDETNKLKSDIENLDHDIKKVIGDDGKLYDAYDINDLLDKNEKN